MTPSVFSHSAENGRNYTRGILISRCESGGLLNQSVITLWRSVWLFSSYRSLRQDLSYLLHFANNLQMCRSSTKNILSPGQGVKRDLSPHKNRFVPNWSVFYIPAENFRHSYPHLLWQHFLFPSQHITYSCPLSDWLFSLFPPPRLLIITSIGVLHPHCLSLVRGKFNLSLSALIKAPTDSI